MKKNISSNILKNVRLIVYDFDGVLTDNKVILREDGMESVVVNRGDGLAINEIKHLGIEQLILTTEKNKVVETRARKLGIPSRKGVDDKKKVLLGYCKQKRVSLESVAYVGNDINDLEVMSCAGCAIAPSDASTEIKNIANIITKTSGGNGVVREILNVILSSKKQSPKSRG